MRTDTRPTAPVWERTDVPLATAIPQAFWDAPAAYLAAHATWLKRSGHHRETAAFAIEGGGALVKHCTFTSLRERVARRLGRTALQREWRVLRHLQRAHGPAPLPLACGWQRQGRAWHAWLVTAQVPGVITFDSVNPPRALPRLYRGARALACALADLHAADVCHGDLHSGNLLFDPRACAWRITDFSHAHIGRATRTELVHDLVQLQHCLGKKVPLKVRVAFLTEYLAAFARATATSSELSGREWRSLWAEIRRKSCAYSIHQAARRTPRCLRATRDLAPLAAWLEPAPQPHAAPYGWTVRTLSRRLVNDLVAALYSETWYLQSNVTLLRNTRDGAAGVWTHPHGRVLVSERRVPRGFLLRCLARWRDGDPLAAWRASWRLDALHVGTPEPLLLLRLPGRVLTAQRYSGAHIAAQALLRAQTLPAAMPPRARLVRAVAAAVALLHDRGVAHGALVPANIHLTPDGQGGVRVLFTGVSSARFYTALPWRCRVRDLARFYSAAYDTTSAAERRLFLRVYCAALSSPCDMRQLLLAIWEASQR